MASKIYGATLANAKFGTDTFDQGIVQTQEIEMRVEDEQIIGTDGQKLGGAKYGEDEELQLTYISNVLAPTAFNLVGLAAVSKITFDGKSWELFNIRKSKSNTGFLTFTATARYSADW